MRTRALDEGERLVAIVGSELQERGRKVFANWGMMGGVIQMKVGCAYRNQA
jgi:hypothetical protein